MTRAGTPGAVLAIDAGQTAIKVRLSTADEVTDAAFAGVRTHEPLLPQLASIARTVAAEHGVALDVVAAGVSGLTTREADPEELLGLLPDRVPARVLLAHDSVTSFLGALGDRRGAVVAAGTGVVTFAVGATRVARVDGWGNIMGDAGSAYWIGREGLEAAMRSYDGRAEPTALLGLLQARWPDVESAYIELQSDPNRVSTVAGFAAGVTSLAHRDDVARGICEAAAAELAISTSTALGRVTEPGDTDPPIVSVVGGVFQSAFVRQRFSARLAQLTPDARVESPRGDGLDGVAALPGLAPTHPLMGQLHVAARVT